MIPKIIHYCWMSGDTYPEKIRRCIDSWKKNLPDYDFILWDAKQFNVEQSIWVKEAYEAKKYAFCADYIRLYALYNYGGIYLDSDVEVVKPYDDLLNLPYFNGLESKGYFEAATIGAEKNNKIIGEILRYYENRHFLLRAYALMNECIYISKPTYYYRLRQNTISTSAKTFRNMKDCCGNCM